MAPHSTGKSDLRMAGLSVVAAAVCLGVQGCGGKVYQSLEEAQNETCVDLADPGQACLDYCLECIRGYHDSLAWYEQNGKEFNEQLVQRCGSTKVCPPLGYIPP
ncbi:unnamed protein product [Symbiodinium sp. CCMP2592]|nr:unnamed protein product [Symbiodinium sp. CCMP2592]